MWTEGDIDQLNGTPQSLLPSSLKSSNGVISDLREWENQMGLPQVPVRVVNESAVTSPPVPSDNDNVAEDEWNLDNQAITGMTPRLSQDESTSPRRPSMPTPPSCSRPGPLTRTAPSR